MTAPPLPNLVIAGVSKAGTTSLFEYLGQHPAICPSRVKEAGYFAPLRFGPVQLAPLDEYRQLFSHWTGQPWRMEATPAYFYGGTRLIEAMRRVLHEPRVIIVLREPTDRLWSEYRYLKSRTLIDGRLSFDDFVSRCEQLRRLGTDRTEANRYYGALSTGVYTDHLPDWLDAFGGNARVVFFEQLVTDPQAVVTSLCEWLGIDTAVVARFDFTPRNETSGHRSPLVQRVAYRVNDAGQAIWRTYPGAQQLLRRAYGAVNATESDGEVLPAESRRRVDDLYRSANQLLADELDRRGQHDVPAWLPRASPRPTPVPTIVRREPAPRPPKLAPRPPQPALRRTSSLRGVVFAGVVALVFVIPWEGMVWFDGVGTLSKAAGAPVAALAALELARHGRMRRLLDVHLLLIGVGVWAALSYFWSIQPDETFGQVMTISQLAVMVVVIWEFTDGPERYRILLGAVVLGAAVVGVATIVGSTTGSIELDRYSAGDRVHPNAVGFVVGLAIPLAWYLASTSESPWLRRLFAAYLPLGVVAVVLTGSRGGAVTTILALLVVPFTARALSTSGRVALLVGIGACVVLLPGTLPDAPLDRLETTSDEIEDGDLNGRFGLWDAAGDVFMERPLGGVGAGASRYAIAEITGRQAGAHNAFLSVAAELGIVGLTIFGLVLLSVGRRAAGLATIEGRVAAVTLVVLGVGLMIRHWEYDKPTWLALALVIGLASTRAASRPRTPIPIEVAT